MKDELTKATVNFIRHCYGDGEATIRRDILKALRTGKTIDSPRAQNALPYLLEKVPEEFLTKNGIPTNFETSTGLSTKLQGQRRRFKMIQK